MSGKRSKDLSLESDGYSIGYGKPPAHTQFKAGHSGNPKGRPKGSLSLLTVLKRALEERVEVTHHGRTKRISKFEVAITQLVNRAAKGDPRATQQLLALAPLLETGSSSGTPGIDPEDRAVVAAVLGRLRDE